MKGRQLLITPEPGDFLLVKQEGLKVDREGGTWSLREAYENRFGKFQEEQILQDMTSDRLFDMGFGLAKKKMVRFLRFAEPGITDTHEDELWEVVADNRERK